MCQQLWFFVGRIFSTPRKEEMRFSVSISIHIPSVQSTSVMMPPFKPCAAVEIDSSSRLQITFGFLTPDLILSTRYLWKMTTPTATTSTCASCRILTLITTRGQLHQQQIIYSKSAPNSYVRAVNSLGEVVWQVDHSQMDSRFDACSVTASAAEDVLIADRGTNKVGRTCSNPPNADSMVIFEIIIF